MTNDVNTSISYSSIGAALAGPVSRWFGVPTEGEPPDPRSFYAAHVDRHENDQLPETLLPAQERRYGTFLSFDISNNQILVQRS